MAGRMQAKVMRVETRTIVVLTEEGDFMRVPLPLEPLRLGQTITVDLPVQARTRRWRPYMTVAAMLVLILTAGLFKPLAMPAAVAAVALDLTPSIELRIDKNNRTVGATAFNQEGRDLLRNVRLKGLDVYAAVDAVLTEAVEMDFLTRQEENVVIATVIPGKGQENAVKVDAGKINQLINEKLSSHELDGYVVVSETGPEVKQQAEEAGLPVNQYLVWQKSKEKGVDIPKDKLRTAPVGQVLNQVNLRVENMFEGTSPAGAGDPRSPANIGKQKGSPDPTPGKGSDKGKGSQEDKGRNGNGAQPGSGEEMAPSNSQGSMIEPASLDQPGQPGKKPGGGIRQEIGKGDWRNSIVNGIRVSPGQEKKNDKETGDGESKDKR